MGGYCINKALLLDEGEIEEYSGWQSDSFEDLWEIAAEFARDRVGNWENPWVEIIGCTSERFNTSEFISCEKRSLWVEQDRHWTDTLMKIFTSLSQIEHHIAAQFLQDPDKDRLMTDITSQIGTALERESFYEARALVTAVENLRLAGLPCFRSAYHLTSGGTDEGYDLRKEDLGPGRRVIVEMAFVWE
ncbi:MAG: hypothetical protein ACKVLA_06525 [Rhodobacterales bacterium]